MAELTPVPFEPFQTERNTAASCKAVRRDAARLAAEGPLRPGRRAPSRSVPASASPGGGGDRDRRGPEKERDKVENGKAEVEKERTRFVFSTFFFPR
ncbi:hypothetical protein GWI33_005960 [Rhynchophorus ferrugineus]|uniref:Uncharacterized protein n=1 Tax=Rhynchophorus ferrugineus TaxID=354439 RepID=A0A834MKS4_RHYFE|nr:hypothetical protein GWI33_005960 [Rhynchophorus ferrugineus]